MRCGPLLRIRVFLCRCMGGGIGGGFGNDARGGVEIVGVYVCRIAAVFVGVKVGCSYFVVRVCVDF